MKIEGAFLRLSSSFSRSLARFCIILDESSTDLFISLKVRLSLLRALCCSSAWATGPLVRVSSERGMSTGELSCPMATPDIEPRATIVRASQNTLSFTEASSLARYLLFATRSPVRDRRIPQLRQKSSCRSHQSCGAYRAVSSCAPPSACGRPPRRRPPQR